MMSNFGHLKRVLLLYLNLITEMVLENDVHNRTNVLEEYIIFHITHIYGY